MELKKQLKELWKICFGDEDKAVKFFLDNYKDKCEILTKIDNDMVVSALYLLPATRVNTGHKEKIYYLYAACTHPDYRNLGLMGMLIEEAKILAKNNGVKYIALVPASENLFGYYAKFGFESYFTIKRAKLTREEMLLYTSDCDIELLELTLEEINSFRNKFLKKKSGSVLWSDDFFKSCMLLNKLTGGNIIAFSNGKEMCYAYYRENSGILEVLELFCSKEMVCHIVKKLLEVSNCSYFDFRLPAFSDCFNEIGKEQIFGMAVSVAKDKKMQISTNHYIGLVKD